MNNYNYNQQPLGFNPGTGSNYPMYPSSNQQPGYPPQTNMPTANQYPPQPQPPANPYPPQPVRSFTDDSFFLSNNMS